jgi:hypothetical protein
MLLKMTCERYGSFTTAMSIPLSYFGIVQDILIGELWKICKCLSCLCPVDIWIVVPSTKEYLGQIIQMGGADVGHSSVEDSIATLNLVRWYVLNKPTLPQTTSTPKLNNPSTTKPQIPRQEVIILDWLILHALPVSTFVHTLSSLSVVQFELSNKILDVSS